MRTAARGPHGRRSAAARIHAASAVRIRASARAHRLAARARECVCLIHDDDAVRFDSAG